MLTLHGNYFVIWLVHRSGILNACYLVRWVCFGLENNQREVKRYTSLVQFSGLCVLSASILVQIWIICFGGVGWSHRIMFIRLKDLKLNWKSESLLTLFCDHWKIYKNIDSGGFIAMIEDFYGSPRQFGPFEYGGS